MSTRMLPIDEVLERTSFSRRTLYNEISAGLFPKPVPLAKRRVAWPEADIEAWLTAKIVAARPKVIA